MAFHARDLSVTCRVLSPSSRPSATTSQACSILAPPMGFCLQRSVRILSRTPFGSPCPAFPWPPGGPFDPSLRVSVARTMKVLRHHFVQQLRGLLRLRASGCPSAASLPRRPCFHTLGFQGSSPEHARFLGAGFNRLPSSHLSWPFDSSGVDSKDLGSGFRHPSPLALAVPRGP